MNWAARVGEPTGGVARKSHSPQRLINHFRGSFDGMRAKRFWLSLTIISCLLGVTYFGLELWPGIRKQLAAGTQAPTATTARGDAQPVVRPPINSLLDGAYRDKSNCNDVACVVAAADRSDAQAEADLGWLYLNGRGVETNVDTAVAWLKRGAEHGSRDAQSDLGSLYFLGEKVPQDYDAAFHWTRLAAQAGQVQAETLLAWLYYDGKGVPKDRQAALKWYNKAAGSGYAYAQSILGWMYSVGIGVNKNETKAVHWLKQAAYGGEVDAQIALAQRYVDGTGVKKSHTEAVRWYRSAANQGAQVAVEFLKSEKASAPEVRR